MIDYKDRTPIVELSRRGNVRFLGYNLLRDVQFDGQPVVPKILGEKNDELAGPIYEVENLSGTDLDLLIQNQSVSYSDKLSVLFHVAGQLEAIDQAGFIPFDRSGSNIRVLSYGADGVSTRQLDIEDVYDHEGDCLYSQENASMSHEVLDLFKEKGVDYWARNVTMLAELAQIAANLANDRLALSEFEKHKWPFGNPKGSTLSELRKSLNGRLGSLDKGTKTDYDFVEFPVVGHEGFKLVNFQGNEVAATESCVRVTNFDVFPDDVAQILKTKSTLRIPVFIGNVSVDSRFTKRGLGPAIWKATMERLISEHPSVIVSHVDDSIPYGWTGRRIPEEIEHMGRLGYKSEVLFKGQTDNKETTVIQYSPI